MRILIFSNTFYPEVGGMESNTETLANVLLNLNHQVSIITGSQLNGKIEINVGYNIIRNNFFFQLLAQCQKHDLVISNGGISIPLSLASQLTGRKQVIIHQMAGRLRPSSKSIKAHLLFKLRLWMAKKAVLHLGVSKACIDSKCIKTSNQGVLYNPIAPEIQEAAMKYNNYSKKYDLLFAGRVIEGKGVYIFANALKKLDSERRNLKILISGNGQALSTLKTITSKFSNVQVCYQDFVKGDKLAQTFASSKVLVLPSSSHQEGSPLSIVEAFAFGVPALVSNQPVMLELIEDNKAGVSFKSGDSNDLANSIKKILNYDSWIKKSQYCKIRAQYFTCEKYTITLNNFLKDLI